MLALQSLLGLLAIPLLAFALSEDRSLLPWRLVVRVVASALLLQIVLALLLLKLPPARHLFEAMTNVVHALQAATDAGTQMVFGYLAGGAAPFDIVRPEASFLLAFKALPVILVLSALVRLLYYWGVLQKVVAAFALVLRRTVGTGGALGTVSAASVFLGLIEAPLLIRPYLAGMGRGALFATMGVVMSTVAGTVLALYAGLLEPKLPGAAGHLLAASFMNVPAALMIARLMVPRGFESTCDEPIALTGDGVRSSMDAIAEGTIEGLKLLATVTAMLIVIVALVSLVNQALGAVTAPLVGKALTLQAMLGVVCAPLAWGIGIPASEAMTAGALLGEKVVLNEFLAYLDLAKVPDAELSARSRLIMTYALCSFANLGSLGILIGGLNAMLPERRAEIVELAPRSVLVGFLSTLVSAAVVGLVA